MVDIPDSLRSVFFGTVQQDADSYVVEIPANEVESGGVDVGEQYRVALVEAPDWVSEGADASTSEQSVMEEEPQRQSERPEQASAAQQSTPPVEEGEIREVEIESVGDQGDGIAKVERGYVVIVSDGKPGDQLRVEVENVRSNVAFASIVGSRS